MKDKENEKEKKDKWGNGRRRPEIRGQGGDRKKADKLKEKEVKREKV